MLHHDPSMIFMATLDVNCDLLGTLFASLLFSYEDSLQGGCLGRCSHVGGFLLDQKMMLLQLLEKVDYSYSSYESMNPEWMNY